MVVLAFYSLSVATEFENGGGIMDSVQDITIGPFS